MRGQQLSKKAQQSMRKKAAQELMQQNNNKQDLQPKQQRILLGTITAERFRQINQKYPDYYQQYKQKYEDEHPGVSYENDYKAEGLTGYVDLIPQAPGFCVSIMSPNYPIFYARELDDEKLKNLTQNPILRMNSQKDIDILLKLGIIKEYKEVMETINKLQLEKKELWLLPDQKVIQVPVKCKNLQDVVMGIHQNVKDNEPQNHEAKALLQEQNYKKIKRLFVWTIVTVIGLMVLYFYIQEKYFDNSLVINSKYNIKQHYDVLGLKSNAKLSELKQHYRKLALKLHPDRNPKCKDCRAKFDQITKAYKAIMEIQYHEQHVPTLFDKKDKGQQVQQGDKDSYQ